MKNILVVFARIFSNLCIVFIFESFIWVSRVGRAREFPSWCEVVRGQGIKRELHYCRWENWHSGCDKVNLYEQLHTLVAATQLDTSFPEKSILHPSPPPDHVWCPKITPGDYFQPWWCYLLCLLVPGLQLSYRSLTKEALFHFSYNWIVFWKLLQDMIQNHKNRHWTLFHKSSLVPVTATKILFYLVPPKTACNLRSQ